MEQVDHVPNEKLKAFQCSFAAYLLRNYAYSNGSYLFDKKTVEAEVRCDYLNVKTGEQRTLYLPVFTYDYLNE
ncbi:MAG: hypothetical protein H6582_03000 [Crocinitomicaceae bacterium]|nr:hypothetical protein [Crocinitomicaceae bacterium]